MITYIFIVLTEDRHADVDAQAFSTEEAAVAFARQEAGDAWWEEELNADMRDDGWVLYLSYGMEGDCIRVLRRELRG